MKKLISSILNTGIGTIQGSYRLSPKTNKKVCEFRETKRDFNEIYSETIPDWFACVITGPNNEQLGIIDSELKQIVIAGKVLPLDYFVTFFDGGDGENGTFQNVTSIKIFFSSPRNHDSEDDFADKKDELTINLEYDVATGDGWGLEYTIEYSLKFRATLSLDFWWDIVSKK